MQNKSKFNTFLLVIIVILLIIGLVYIFLNNSKQNGEIKQVNILNDTGSCISDTGKIMTYQRAFEIAKNSSCADVGEFTMNYGCSNNAGGLIIISMNLSNKPSCNFDCLISIDTEEVTEGWMCTGAGPLPIMTRLKMKIIEIFK